MVDEVGNMERWMGELEDGWISRWMGICLGKWMHGKEHG